jgi:hypothetical protein
LLCLVAESDEEVIDEDSDIEILLAFSLFKEHTLLRFIIDLEKIDDQVCIDLFR